MTVIYSTQAIVEYDGLHYYSNPVKATYPRYLSLGKKVVVVSYCKNVKKAKSDLIEDGSVDFCFVKKINSAKALLDGTSKKNEELIKEQVRKADFCVAHVPCAHSYQVIKYAKLYGKPYMTVVVGCAWDSLWNYGWRGKLMAPNAFFELRKIQRDSPYSIYVTNRFLQDRYPTNGRSISCSNVNISTGLPGVLEQRLQNIEKRKNEGRTLRIGTAAAVDVPYKGQEYVIKALKQLKVMGLSFEYHLAGNGSSDRLKAIAEKEGVASSVFFHGSMPHSKILEFMDDLDVYVQPSKQEGLPRATIEAMSRGCLCLGSRIAGIPELLEPEFLFSKGDVQGIAGILSRITPEKQVAQANRNYETAKEYDKDILNKRRTQFILEFKENSMERL